MDDASLSFNDKGNAIANYLMNTKDFAPDNVWVDDDSRISDVDLHLPPSPSQSGEQLWKHFHSLKTKFALVDEVFWWPGNLEVGADIDEADCFDGHIRRLLPDETAELQKLLLFAFWVFDKKPPKFVSHSKPEEQPFDTSTATSNVLAKGDNNARKRMHASNVSEALAKAVASLALSEEEQKEIISHWKTNNYMRKMKRSVSNLHGNAPNARSFLMGSVLLSNETKQKWQPKLNELAETFLKEHF